MKRLTVRNYKNTTLDLESCQPYLKLGQLEDIEEELGIDFITLKRVIQIIKEYKVDIWLLQECDYDNYIRIRKEAKIINDLIRTDTDIVENIISVDDFIFLKEMIINERNIKK